MHKFTYTNCKFTLFHPEKAVKGCGILLRDKEIYGLGRCAGWTNLECCYIELALLCFNRVRRDLVIPLSGKQISKK